MDKLHFANGIHLSDDEEFLIVAETSRNRIHRYFLNGHKKGTHDIFIDGLPGMPDNIKSDGKGGFLVPLVIAVDKDNPAPSQAIGQFPLLRKFVARVLGLIQLGFSTINRFYPCDFAAKGVHFIGHFSSMVKIHTPPRATVLHLSKNGEILDSLYGFNKKITLICDAHISKDMLYLGSPFNDYIGRVSLTKIGWGHLIAESRKRDVPLKQPILTTTTQRPTTTTSQRPTTTATSQRPTTTTTTQRPTTTTQRPTTTTTTQRPTTTTTTQSPTTTTTSQRPTTTTTSQPPPTTTTSHRPTVTTTTQRPPSTTQIPTTTSQRSSVTTTPPPTTTAQIQNAPKDPVKNAPLPAPSPSTTTSSTAQQSSPKQQEVPKTHTTQAPVPQQQSKPVPSSKTTPSSQNPGPPTGEKATVSPAKESAPTVAQPMKDQSKSVPVGGDTSKTKY